MPVDVNHIQKVKQEEIVGFTTILEEKIDDLLHSRCIAEPIYIPIDEITKSLFGYHMSYLEKVYVNKIIEDYKQKGWKVKYIPKKDLAITSYFRFEQPKNNIIKRLLNYL